MVLFRRKLAVHSSCIDTGWPCPVVDAIQTMPSFLTTETVVEAQAQAQLQPLKETMMMTTTTIAVVERVDTTGVVERVARVAKEDTTIA